MNNRMEKAFATNGPGLMEASGFWLDTEHHRNWLLDDARRQLEFFQNSHNVGGGFYQLDPDGNRLSANQELFATCRLVHSYSLGKQYGFTGCDSMIDHGVSYIREHHHDPEYGGYFWSLSEDSSKIADDRKLAYGHAFVLLAAASAKQAGHPDAEKLLDDIQDTMFTRFWCKEHGLFSDETNRDWSPFSNYRGFNANMHSTEAMLAAYEATNNPVFLEKAGSILEFFVSNMASKYDYRLPEHYTGEWEVDPAYEGNPMFRPAGTTPGHSLELARILLQYRDLTNREDTQILARSRRLIERALKDAWDVENGGLHYTLNHDGSIARPARFWWPVTEAIGALAALVKLERKKEDEIWYRKLWKFADEHFIDHELGGWYPEIDANGNHTHHQFKGKPDIYHSLQASLFPLAPGVSGLMQQQHGKQ